VNTPHDSNPWANFPDGVKLPDNLWRILPKSWLQPRGRNCKPTFPMGPDVDTETGATIHWDETEAAVLKPGSGDQIHNKSIGDLVIMTLVDGLWEGSAGHGQDWPTLEGRMLKMLAVELKCFGMALACEGAEMDQPESESIELTELEAVEMVQLLARRAEAGAELANRIRTARWGHPSYGGCDPEVMADTPTGRTHAEWERQREAEQAAEQSDKEPSP
jgi:hypothetical protein